MTALKKYCTSLNSTILIALILALFFIFNDFKHIIAWDTFGQYLYLPNLFIDHTFKLPLSHYDALNQTYEFSSTLYQFNNFNDIASTKYTLGLALLSAPFFLIGHLFAYLFHFPMDGYSLPYSIAFGVSTLFYFLVGIFALRKVLRYFLSEKATIFALIAVVFGTNVFLNVVSNGAFTHNFAFTFLCLLLLSTIRFHENPTVKNGIFLGASLAILGLIRFPDLLFGLIPVLWNVTSPKGLVEKIRFFLKEKTLPLIATFIAFVFFLSFQLIYWKIVSGHFFIDSYANNPGEGFDWLHPYTIPFLFSFKKGWLLYTPIAIFAILGFIKLWKSNENGRILTFTFFLFLYVVSCWTTWWYAGSFSSRAMIDIYPIVAIGLGLALSFVKIRKLILGLASLFILLNLFQSWQMKHGILSAEQMSRRYYFSTFGQVSYPTKAQKALLEPGFFDFDGLMPNEMQLKPLYQKTFTLQKGKLDNNNWYTENITLNIPNYRPQKLYLVRATWHYDASTFQSLAGLVPNICTEYHGKAYSWRSAEENDIHLTVDTTKHCFTMRYIAPNLRSRKDHLRIQVWRKDPNDITLQKVSVKIDEILGKKAIDKIED